MYEGQYRTMLTKQLHYTNIQMVTLRPACKWSCTESHDTMPCCRVVCMQLPNTEQHGTIGSSRMVLTCFVTHMPRTSHARAMRWTCPRHDTQAMVLPR